MQGFNWNDLRFVLALHRAGSLAEAGRALGVDETTVARRIKALEHALAAALFVRNGHGQFEPTETGRKITERAIDIGHQAYLIQEQASADAGKLVGTVRITAVPVIINRVLVPSLHALQDRHPDLTIELIPEQRNLNLTRREADLAVRFARPVQGGSEVQTQKLGEMDFALYKPAAISNPHTASWIQYDDTHAYLPQAKWLQAAARAEGPMQPGLRIGDLDTAIEAVAAGQGKTLLPRGIADRDQRLLRCQSSNLPPPPGRELWLLSHSAQKTLQSIRVVKDWLRAVQW